jgi:hypothetical protein
MQVAIITPIMGFIEFYLNNCRLLLSEPFHDIPEWLFEAINKREPFPFHFSRHSVVRKVCHPVHGEMFIKTFNPCNLFIKLKDSLRGSRAYRAWKAGEMLEEYGFCAPKVVAVGEKRYMGLLQESFMVTLPLKGSPLLQFFLTVDDFRKKREMVRQLGKEIGRMHKLGIIHGDLIPGNVFVAEESGKCTVCLLDNESTRRVTAVRMNERIKNLVQINRVVVPRITATDRVRFFDAYLRENPELAPIREEMLRKVGKVTSERVMRHRGIPPEERGSISFRALMAWKEHEM